MPWEVSGSYFEMCNCNVVCPCTASLSLGATNDRCKVTLVFNIHAGEVEDVVSFGVETGQPVRLTGIFHPAGSELSVARATRSTIDAFGIAYEVRSAFSTTQFSWSA